MRLRYLEVAPAAPHYESIFAVLTHPQEAQALWIRTTVRKVPHGPATGAVWVTWFGADGVRAAKLLGQPVAPGGHGIQVGGVTQGPAGSRGSIDLPDLAARWDLDFVPRAEPLEHLTPTVLYARSLPRTKSTSPVPDLDVTGSLEIAADRIDLAGWTGMLGQNWGSQHAERWVWLRAGALGVREDGWLDVVLGRVRLGPALTPWTGFGAVLLDDGLHRLGGLLRRPAAVELHADGARVTLAGADLRLTVRALVELPRTVGWEYADPTGRRHEVVNSSVARMTVRVDHGGRAVELTPRRRGVLEVGGDRRALDVPLQPFHD